MVQQPNFFGRLEDVDALTDWARARAILVIAIVNPTSLALLKPPGEWGARGADIAVGEGQPLGVPLSSGGPYLGFMTARMEHVRQLPGRIVGRTLDVAGREGFTLTLQAREQHIRRAKATSNICTNQGLAVTAATIYMSLMGPQGLTRTAAAAHARTRELIAALTRVPGAARATSGRTRRTRRRSRTCRPRSGAPRRRSCRKSGSSRRCDTSRGCRSSTSPSTRTSIRSARAR